MVFFCKDVDKMYLYPCKLQMHVYIIQRRKLWKDIFIAVSFLDTFSGYPFSIKSYKVEIKTQ